VHRFSQTIKIESPLLSHLALNSFNHCVALCKVRCTLKEASVSIRIRLCCGEAPCSKINSTRRIISAANIANINVPAHHAGNLSQFQSRIN